MTARYSAVPVALLISPPGRTARTGWLATREQVGADGHMDGNHDGRVAVAAMHSF
jgi:hypothetical protein